MQIKDYTKFFGDSYKKAYNKIQQKYSVASDTVDREYEAERKRINDNAYAAKNNVSASSTVNLANARKSLLDKGLERSGDAVNTEIRSALSKSRAFSDIDIEANRAHQQNALSRMNQKSALETKRLEEEGNLEKSAVEKLIDQYNLDREHERKVSESEEDKRRWDIQNEQDKARDERDHAFEKEKFEEDKNQNAFENELKEKQFIESQNQNDFNNSMAEKEYILSEKQQQSGTKNSGTGNKNGEEESSYYDGITLGVSPKELLRIIVSSNTTNDKKESYGKIKSIIYTLLNDTTLSSDYKNELSKLAMAMGYTSR